jgi:hypothetical protein
MTRLRRATAIACASVLLVAVGAVVAAVEASAVVDLRFLSNCPAIDGFYWTWNATTDPGKEQFSQDALVPLSWSAGSPISQAWISDSNIDQELWFILLASDAETVLFERRFDREASPASPTQQFAIRTTLDCSTVPYREVQAPDTAVPAHRGPSGGAWVLIALAGLLIARGLWRGGTFAPG